jgi:hypothetical protein
MSQFPCPNPVCTHSFAPEQVQSAGTLKCPVCGQSFQFRAGAAPAQPTPPSAQPAVQQAPRSRAAARPSAAAARPESHAAKTLPPLAIPVAKPVTPAQKPYDSDLDPASLPPPSTATAPDPTFSMVGDDGPLVRPRFRPMGRSRKHYAFLGVGILAGIGVVILAVLGIKAALTPQGGGSLTDKGRVLTFTARNQKNAEEKAFKLVLADKVWIPDNEIRQRMSVNTVWKSVDKDKEGWFAVAVRDYGLSRPREAELLRSGIEKLEQYFEGALELAEKAEPAKLCQAQGQKLLFKGQINSVTWWGYMYMLAHHGFGYWFYVSAPSKDEAAELFAKDLQGSDFGFLLYTERKGWREQPPKTESFLTGNGALTVAVPESVFEKHPAKDQDEHGELYLFAKYQKDKDNRKNADILILALEKQGDLKEAMKSTKKYLEDKRQEESKDYKIEVSGEGGDQSDLGISASVGNRPGRIAEYKLVRGDTAARFWIVAAVNDADNVYVIRCDCNWENRQIWREDFQELLKSVRFRKAPKADPKADKESAP